MAKRADWEMLKQMKYILPYLNHLPSKLPLIDISYKLSPGYTIFNNIAGKQLPLDCVSKIKKFVITDFVLLMFSEQANKKVYIRVNSNHLSGVHITSYNYEEEYIDKPVFIMVSKFNNNGETKNIVYEKNKKNGKEVSSKYAPYFMLLTIYELILYIENSNLYPVEVKGTQNRHRPNIAHDKKPWQRSDLVSIQFLNKLPTSERQPSKGGHHVSPRYHQRRGHTHTMRNEIFKNHPDYMKPIYRKPVWVGEKETIINGTTYKVL